MKLIKSLFCLLFLLSCQHKTPTEPNGKNQLPQWPMFGGNLRNTSNVAAPMDYYAGPQLGQVVWSWIPPNPLEAMYATPSIGFDGTIYLPTTPISSDADTVGYIYAITPDGRIKWQYKTERGNFAGGAVGLDGAYYVGSKDGYFYAIEKNGELLWRHYWGQQLIQRPAINNAGNIVVSSGTSIKTLDRKSGEELWVYSVVGSGDISLDVEDNIYIGTSDGLLSLSSQGAYRWNFATSSAPRGTVISHNGSILFTVPFDSLLYSLNDAGLLQWTFNLSGTTLFNAPAITKQNDIIVLRSDDRHQKLFTVGPKGQLLVSIDISDVTGEAFVYLDEISPVIDGSGTIYLGANLSAGDDFFAITPNGKAKWTLDLGNTRTCPITGNPVLSPDGIMYLITEGSLNAIR